MGCWSGTEVLIWGGYTNLNGNYEVLHDGSRYNPATDSWSPISLINSPGGRIDAASVWTGTEMIIWAGADSIFSDYHGNLGGEFTNSGGKYNPSTNTWTTMSLVDAPIPMYDIPSVWTGNYMVIWGRDISGNTGGGGYNPTTNSWLPISASVNAVRGATRMFWTGTHVLMLAFNDSIGRYNPNTDSWDVAGIYPGGYFDYNEAIVWTGTELLIYNKPTNQIFKYNPNTNTWSAPITVGGTISVDPNFNIQSAVWTDDNELILYGNYENYPDNTVRINRYYRYSTSLNRFVTTFNETILYNRFVKNYFLFIKAGNILFKWGGTSLITDNTNENYDFFSNQGTRIYLTSGISIPTIYVSANSSRPLYLYQKN